MYTENPKKHEHDNVAEEEHAAAEATKERKEQNVTEELKHDAVEAMDEQPQLASKDKIDEPSFSTSSTNEPSSQSYASNKYIEYHQQCYP